VRRSEYRKGRLHGSRWVERLVALKERRGSGWESDGEQREDWSRKPQRIVDCNCLPKTQDYAKS